jgi:diguanylate cyclase (GGDEF)-like protein
MLQKKILLVDDQPINRAILRKMLTGDNYLFLEAADGRAALDILHKEQGHVSAILLDLIMPGMNGQDFLDEKAKDPELANIPVIVTTQMEDSQTEINVLAKGANDFLHKPYNALITRQRLTNLIKLHETVDFVNAIERDGMTGVYTKEAFYRLAKGIITANPDTEYDILITDLEHFKLVNELFSMAEGNRLLRYFGQWLEHAMQKNDIQLCGRSGSDVFLILTERKQAATDNLLHELEAAVNAYDIGITLELKVGCYHVEPDTPVDTMCDRASRAVNSIKGKYGKNFCLYEDSLRDRLLQEQEILSHMQPALENHEFVVYYQPKFCMTTRATLGAEALVRWQRPKEGLVPPDSFIPLFERNGFITTLDMYVWDRVCADVAAWYKKYGDDMVPISVNVSRVDIYNPKLDEILVNMVKKHNIPIELLHLEITESASIISDTHLIKTVKSFHEAGFTLEMDDFGKGYSSLNMLSELPIDVIKLDRDFLRNSNNNEKQKHVINFILALAKKMGIKTIAEGVETEAQLEYLHAAQCDMGQGYFYAKPMPEADFSKMLEKQVSMKKTSRSCPK